MNKDSKLTLTSEEVEKRHIVSNGIHLVPSFDSGTRPRTDGSAYQFHVLVVVVLEEGVKVEEVVTHLLVVALCGKLNNTTDGEGGGPLVGHKVS